jgi:hypothetical protein
MIKRTELVSGRSACAQGMLPVFVMAISTALAANVNSVQKATKNIIQQKEDGDRQKDTKIDSIANSNRMNTLGEFELYVNHNDVDGMHLGGGS